MPHGYDDHENLIQRFLEGAQWKHKEAYDTIIVHHKFTKQFPVELSDFKQWLEELNKGYSYVYKRDRKFRPICYINMEKLKKVKADHSTLINMSTYMTSFVISRALIPGKIENWITIIDFKNVGVTEVPTKLIKALTKPL